MLLKEYDFWLFGYVLVATIRLTAVREDASFLRFEKLTNVHVHSRPSFLQRSTPTKADHGLHTTQTNTFMWISCSEFHE